MSTEFSKKLIYKFREAGLVKTLQLIFKNITYILSRLGRSRVTNVDETSGFDKQFGTDTSGIVELCELGMSKEKRAHGVRYEATYTSLAQKILQDLDIQHGNFTFVDVGAGKGRILLLASEYPYRHVIGVEFSQELAAISKKNNEVYSKTGRNRCEIEVLCMDARQYAIPDGNVVLYLYNPFGPAVLWALLSHIKESLLSHPKELLIIYVNPMHLEVFESMNFLTPIKQERQYVIFKGLPKAE